MEKQTRCTFSEVIRLHYRNLQSAFALLTRCVQAVFYWALQIIQSWALWLICFPSAGKEKFRKWWRFQIHIRSLEDFNSFPCRVQHSQWVMSAWQEHISWVKNITLPRNLCLFCAYIIQHMKWILRAALLLESVTEQWFPTFLRWSIPLLIAKKRWW